MSQKGFAPIIIVILVMVVGIAGGYLYLKKTPQKTDNLSSPSPYSFSPSSTPHLTPVPSSSNKPTALPTVVVTPTSTPVPTFTPQPTVSLLPTSTPVTKVTCDINVSVTSGWSPVYVRFDYTASDQSRVVSQEWDLDGSGTWESEAKSTDWTYKDVKSYEAKLRLKLSDGSYSDVCTKTITVNPPKVTCSINANTTSGIAPLPVQFTYGAEFNGVSDDYVAEVQWDFNGDGSWDTPYDVSSQTPPLYTYSAPGNYTAKMHLKTHKGTETDICNKSISVN